VSSDFGLRRILNPRDSSMDISQPSSFSTLRDLLLEETRPRVKRRAGYHRMRQRHGSASKFLMTQQMPNDSTRHHHTDNDPCWYGYRLMHASLAFPKLERSSGRWNEVCVRFWLIDIERTCEAGLACMSSAMALDYYPEELPRARPHPCSESCYCQLSFSVALVKAVTCSMSS
jgi:hypothetical protein